MGKREYIQLELLFDDTQVEAKEDSCFLRAKLLKINQICKHFTFL